MSDVTDTPRVNTPHPSSMTSFVESRVSFSEPDQQAVGDVPALQRSALVPRCCVFFVECTCRAILGPDVVCTFNTSGSIHLTPRKREAFSRQRRPPRKEMLVSPLQIHNPIAQSPCQSSKGYVEEPLVPVPSCCCDTLFPLFKNPCPQHRLNTPHPSKSASFGTQPSVSFAEDSESQEDVPALQRCSMALFRVLLFSSCLGKFWCDRFIFLCTSFQGEHSAPQQISNICCPIVCVLCRG
mgnify:CR=1 FL=1